MAGKKKVAAKKVAKVEAVAVPAVAEAPKAVVVEAPKHVESADVKRARKELAQAMSRVETLNKFIASYEELFGSPSKTARKSAATNGAAAGERTTTRKGGPTLEVIFRQVLTGKKDGMTLEAITQACLDQGYETKSDKFAAVVGQLLNKLRTAKELKVLGQAEDNPRQKLYALV